MTERVIELQGGFKPEPVPPGFELTQLPAGLPLVETIETSRGPWAKNGAYGRLVVAEYPASLDATPVTIFSGERQPGPPRPRTLHLFRSDAQLVAGVPNANCDVYARVTYGVGGVQNQFLCDWSRGGQLSLVADTIRVEAVPYAPQAFLPYKPVPGTQTLGAMLGIEGAAPPRPPTFTTQSDSTTSGNGLVFLVPDFARWVYPCYAVTKNATDLLKFRNFGNAQLKQVVITDDIVNFGTPIPGGTTEILYSNVGPAGTQVLLQYELGL